MEKIDEFDTVLSSLVRSSGYLAQWTIKSCGATKRRSVQFPMGIWDWFFAEKKNGDMKIYLKPVSSRLIEEQSPLVQFVLRIYQKEESGIRSCISPVYEQVFRKDRICVWKVDSIFTGTYTIQVEFRDMKIASISGSPGPLWTCEGMLAHMSTRMGVGCLSRMLSESIHTDVTIKTLGGTLDAHKAVLSSASSVFKSMFSFDSAETKMSTISITDISLGCMRALLNYIYGNIEYDEFWEHRLELLFAADKYDISDLKNFCENWLIEDIHSGNVLVRLHEAMLLGANKLKAVCLLILFDYWIYSDLKDEILSLCHEGSNEELSRLLMNMMNSRE